MIISFSLILDFNCPVLSMIPIYVKDKAEKVWPTGWMLSVTLAYLALGLPLPYFLLSCPCSLVVKVCCIT